MKRIKNALNATWTFYGKKVVPVIWFLIVPWFAVSGSIRIYNLGYEHTTQGIYGPICQIAASYIGMIFCCAYLFVPLDKESKP